MAKEKEYPTEWLDDFYDKYSEAEQRRWRRYKEIVSEVADDIIQREGITSESERAVVERFCYEVGVEILDEIYYRKDRFGREEEEEGRQKLNSAWKEFNDKRKELIQKIIEIENDRYKPGERVVIDKDIVEYDEDLFMEARDAVIGAWWRRGYIAYTIPENLEIEAVKLCEYHEQKYGERLEYTGIVIDSDIPRDIRYEIWECKRCDIEHRIGVFLVDGSYRMRLPE